jgi:hypothetical protein
MIALAIASVYGIYAVFAATVNTSPLIDAPELTGVDVFPTGVRLITPFFNIYGASHLSAAPSGPLSFITAAAPSRIA